MPLRVEHAPGPRVVVGLEGTRSYGIGLARVLTGAGLTIVEVECPRRQTRRRSKSDPIDARLAALQVLRMPEDRKALPRSDGDREAIRILLGARHDLTVARTAQINRLRALLLTGDDEDRLLARVTMTEHNLVAIARRRGRTGESTETQVRRAEARRLALAIRDGARTLADNKRQLSELVEAFAPGLQDKLGVGPVSGGQLIVSWSYHGRCRHEAAFAALAGVSPVPASSGRTHRHRLNRGGDRQLNRALHCSSGSTGRVCAVIPDPAQRRGTARQRAAAASTINRRVAAVRALFEYLVMTGVRADNPVPSPRRGQGLRPSARGLLGHLGPGRPRTGGRLVRQPRLLPESLDADAVDVFVSSLRTHRDRAMVWAMLLGGLRSAEVRSLRLADVDFGRRRLRVLGKGSKERVVPVDAVFFTELSAYLRLERPPGVVTPECFVVLRGPTVGAPVTEAGL
ncbi:hypothetical protein R1CP_38780 (plasmid) [Rhodococcus opacus]|uniref:Tyr recombinase domain-containing protein n=1 Tax=Rhodococcus opacus TaxID=37919 RepID=A0A1B1KI33_RHOOP|nr:hypothetical protein R1CP_38275 [Rhodococcus opacus]ANS32347.1 hypothetical protein R1CP_38780 [Rhodococcus opacus]